MMKIFQEKFGKSEYLRNFAIPNDNKGNAEIAQLVEHNLAKVGVASSSLVFRSLQGRPSGRPFSLFPDSRRRKVFTMLCYTNLYIV